MEPSSMKPKISEEKSLDPFENALAEYLLQELMFQHLTGDEVKKVHEVSTMWNDIAADSKTCGVKLRLTINRGGSIHDKLQIILKNKRKYGSLMINRGAMFNEHNTRLLQELVAGLGTALKEFWNIGASMKTTDISVLLKSLHNLEELRLPKMYDDDGSVHFSPLLLPKIRSVYLFDPTMSILDMFANVSTLEYFSLIFEINVTNVNDFENFILRQNKLKELIIHEHRENQDHQIFSDLSRIKFRLESISLLGISIDKDSAVQLFQQQQNLKKIRIQHFNEPNRIKFREILRSIWTLPKLESVDYGDESLTDEDLIALSDIRNESVNHIMSWESVEAQVDGRIFEIFPNIEHYEMFAENWELNNVPSGKLKTFESEYLTESLVYQPPLADFDQEKFESDVIEFFHQSSEINSVEIGRDEWIEQGVRLSINFWRKLFDNLQQLETIFIYNCGDIKELVQLLINSKRNFNLVQIVTNAVGSASVDGMETPSWLQIAEFE
jgi:hypothetical protein